MNSILTDNFANKEVSKAFEPQFGTLTLQDQNETLTVEFPNLGRNDVIVSGTSMLSFKVNLNSSGGSADANRTIVNNLGRAVVSKVVVKLKGQEIYSLNDADIFLCFQDLWKTSKERENAVYQGIQSEAIRKIRINAGDKGSVAKDVAAKKKKKKKKKKVLGNMFYIPLDFEILSSHNPFFQYELKDKLSYELTFNSYGRVVVSSDTSASYRISEIKLEFDVVNSPELAQMIRNKYSGKSVVLYDRVFRSGKEKLNKSDTLWNIDLKPNARSVKGVLILFVDPADGGANYARDSEKFYNPKIEKASVNIAGNPNPFTGSNYLFSSLSTSEERKRHNLATEKLQHDRDIWNQEHLQRIDYINDQLKRQGHAERAFASADDAMRKYYDMTGALMDPLPPEPQLYDYLDEDQKKAIQNGELTLIGLGMLGTGVLMYMYL